MGMIKSFFDNPINLLRIPAVLIALVFHELMHAYTAYKLGDVSQPDRGRLTLNPLKHLHPIGTLMLLFAGFGFARPVTVTTRYFKKYKRDMALTSLAGPLTNLIIAFLAGFVLVILKETTSDVSMLRVSGEFIFYVTAGTLRGIVGLFFYFLITVNIGLGLFNLIPIPPLDGSKILAFFLPGRWYALLMRYEQYGMLVLLVLFMMNALNFLNDIIWYVFSGFIFAADAIVSGIIGLFA